MLWISTGFRGERMHSAAGSLPGSPGVTIRDTTLEVAAAILLFRPRARAGRQRLQPHAGHATEVWQLAHA